MTNDLDVMLADRRAGTLIRERGGRVEFRFDPDWLADRASGRLPFSCLSQSLTPLGIDAPHPHRRLMTGGTALPPFFENLLPEGGARGFLAGRHGVKPANGFELLRRGGDSLFGAIRIVPADPSSSEDDVTGFDRTGLPGFMLAGVQRKLSLPDGRRLTLTDNHSIVKLAGEEYPYLTDNEMLMMHLSRTAGFEVPDFSRQDIDVIQPWLGETVVTGRQVFAIRRFDRVNGRRIHCEDVMQAAGLLPSEKYGLSHEFVAAVMQAAGCDPVEIIRRIALNIATGNGDGHGKNFALIYPGQETQGAAAVAPVYDIVCTRFYGDDTLALSLGKRKRWQDLDETCFRVFATKLGWDPDVTAKIAVDTVDQIIAAWHSLAFQQWMRETVPGALHQVLPTHWRDVPLLRDRLECGHTPEWQPETGSP